MLRKVPDSTAPCVSATAPLPRHAPAVSKRTVTAEFLAAVAASLGVRLAACLLVASSIGVVQAGSGAGIVTVAVPRRMALQGTFPGTAAKFEGYGPGCATWPRLRGLLNAGSGADRRA